MARAGIRHDMRFKAEGVTAVIRCQHCQAEMDNGALFCDYCGQELSERPRAQFPASPFPGPVPGGARATTPPQPPQPPQPQPQVDRLPTAIVLRLASDARFVLKDKSAYMIGRIGTDRVQPDVDLAPLFGYEKGVSRMHVTIHLRRDGVFVEDMDSKNETIHNGFRLGARQLYPLRDGDELKLGGIFMRVEFQYD